MFIEKSISEILIIYTSVAFTKLYIKNNLQQVRDYDNGLRQPTVFHICTLLSEFKTLQEKPKTFKMERSTIFI